MDSSLLLEVVIIALLCAITGFLWRIVRYISKKEVELDREIARNDWGDDEDDDPLLIEAKEVVIRDGKASAAILQRRLRVGYARAARILDILEDQGIIAPSNSAMPRAVIRKKIIK